MRLVKHQPPVFVELKTGADPVQAHQYHMPQEARKEITPHTWKLLAMGVLRPGQSTWNTPLLPVKKTKFNDYCHVQYLWEVIFRVMKIHPTVPNPYTLLRSLPPDRKCYSVLDLKNTFLSLPLTP